MVGFSLRFDPVENLSKSVTKGEVLVVFPQNCEYLGAKLVYM